MSIEQQLQEDLKDAMRQKQADVVATIRQAKSKIQEAVNAKDFSGELNDELCQKVIISYCKSLEKAMSELESAGERSLPLRTKYAAEISYLRRYLPELLDEKASLALVQAAVAALPARDPKFAGKVIGQIMKEHKGKVDAGLTKRLVDEALK